jgi:hypothetical protein
LQNTYNQEPHMANKAQLHVADEAFTNARATFDAMVNWLGGDDVPQTEADIERTICERGRELMRQLLEARFDLLHAHECTELARTGVPEDVEVRARNRQLETEFGRIRLWRNGWKKQGDARARFPLDEQLNLPRKLYSHPLRERVADEARTGAWDQAVSRIDRATGAHVPKRQAEQQTIAAAQDFEAFYEQRPQPANDTLSERALLCISSDSKGVAMRPEALRDATRKAAEAEEADAVRGDPMAPKKLRKHDKRMAVVTAVWQQEPHRRTAKQIIANLHSRPQHSTKPRTRARARKASKTRAPRPQNKRLSASVQNCQAEQIAAMFDEAERRDPEHRATAVALVDGEEHQLAEIQRQADQRKWNLTIVLDIIHAISYLWLAAFALCAKEQKECERMVVRLVTMLLTGAVCDVIGALHQTATRRGLDAKAREPVEKCVNYLRNNAWFMRYPEFLSQGFPIATGVIEGACRHLVQDRLGITGARWGLAGAEAILKLRAIHSSGDWDDYWRFHEKQEAQRNYAAAA